MQGPTPIQVSVGAKNSYNVSAATVLKTAPGRVYTVNVVTAGSTVGSLNDSATLGGVAAANLMAHIPNTVGTYSLQFPYFTGLVVTPGTGQVLSINWS